ncbi:MAG TPA: hypothetical protein VEH31_39225 [Streptosporangiaceae bacterium]|nr:hypothetical protein [Streptosporangiaceae bacterium]HYA50928.1 hypothetical protein [Streptosporangiaceae bacterium]
MNEAEFGEDYELARRMHGAATDGTLAFEQEYLLATAATRAGG